MANKTYLTQDDAPSTLQAIRAGNGGQPESVTAGGVQAAGSVQFSANPTDGDTIVMNGVTVTFGAAGDVAVVTDLATTLDDLRIFLEASVDALLTVATYTDDNTDLLTVTYDTNAAAGNEYTIDVSDLTATPTAADATLEGGSDTEEVSLDTENSTYAMTAAVAQDFTLADGIEFQRKALVMTATSGSVVITPTNLTGGTTITLDAAAEYSNLQFLNGSWVQVAGTATVA